MLSWAAAYKLLPGICFCTSGHLKTCLGSVNDPDEGPPAGGECSEPLSPQGLENKDGRYIYMQSTEEFFGKCLTQEFHAWALSPPEILPR